MRPKPSREWVMLELERLGVRVVSGRLGRKAVEEEEEKKPGGEFPSYVKFSTFAFDSNVNAFYRDASWSSIRKEW